MPTTRAHVIVNTRSGNHDEQAIRNALHTAFDDERITWDWHLRVKGESRRDLTRAALEDGADIIIAAGGDGTVAKCADVVAEFPSAKLGILPTGTGNLLARELGIPMAVDAAALAIAEGRTRGIDAMEVNGKRRCFSHVSMGTYSRMAEADTPEDKQRLGRLAYVKYLADEISEHRSWTFELTTDDTRRTVEASLVLVANVGAVGIPGLRWGDEISPDDGHLEVCLVTASTPAEYVKLAAAALARRFDTTDEIEHITAEHHIRVETAEDIPVRGDGKQIGTGLAEIRVLPHAVDVFVPAGTAEARD